MAISMASISACSASSFFSSSACRASASARRAARARLIRSMSWDVRRSHPVSVPWGLSAPPSVTATAIPIGGGASMVLLSAVLLSRRTSFARSARADRRSASSRAYRLRSQQCRRAPRLRSGARRTGARLPTRSFRVCHGVTFGRATSGKALYYSGRRHRARSIVMPQNPPFQAAAHCPLRERRLSCSWMFQKPAASTSVAAAWWA